MSTYLGPGLRHAAKEARGRARHLRKTAAALVDRAQGTHTDVTHGLRDLAAELERFAARLQVLARRADRGQQLPGGGR